MSKKNILVFFSLLYLLSTFLFTQQTLDYKSFVWFVLVSNFICGIIAIFITVIVTLTKNEEGAIKNTVHTLLAIVPVILFHLFAATFLSFLANWSEFSLMTAERTLKKELAWADIASLFIKYLPFYFPYILTKAMLFFVPKSSLHSGFIHVRDALLLIVTSFAVPLALLKLSETFPINQNATSFYCISFFFFVPWSLFFGRDIFGHQEDKVPLFKATTQFPIKVIERGPRGWGLLIMAFSLIFISVSFLGFNKKFEFHVLQALIFFIPFFSIGSLLFIVGLNMQWAEKEVTITREDVSGRVRMLIPFPKTVHWRQPLIDYALPTKDIRNHRGDVDSSAYATYEIKMNLKSQRPKKKFSLEPSLNVVLYRAYHPDNLDQELAQYRQLFSFMKK